LNFLSVICWSHNNIFPKWLNANTAFSTNREVSMLLRTNLYLLKNWYNKFCISCLHFSFYHYKNSNREFNTRIKIIWILLNKNKEERLLSTVIETKKKRMLSEETAMILMQFDIHTCKIIKGVQSYNQTRYNISNMLWQKFVAKSLKIFPTIPHSLFYLFQLIIDIHFDFNLGVIGIWFQGIIHKIITLR